MKKRKQDQEAVIEAYDYLGKSASTTDYTGLIPFAPKNDYELESYETIYPFRPPCAGREKEPDAAKC